MYLCTHDSPNINQEIMTLLQERLFTMQDKQHAAFQAKLTPGVEQPHLAPLDAQQNHPEGHRELQNTPKQKEYLRTLKIK